MGSDNNSVSSKFEDLVLKLNLDSLESHVSDPHKWKVSDDYHHGKLSENENHEELFWKSYLTIKKSSQRKKQFEELCSAITAEIGMPQGYLYIDRKIQNKIDLAFIKKIVKLLSIDKMNETLKKCRARISIRDFENSILLQIYHLSDGRNYQMSWYFVQSMSAMMNSINIKYDVYKMEKEECFETGILLKIVKKEKMNKADKIQKRRQYEISGQV